MKFYTIYKITNIKTQKSYIGMHETFDLNDGYMGSGKYIKQAIKKHGEAMFKKKIIKICSSRKEMIECEKSIISDLKHTYNLKPGGAGGWYIFEGKIPKPISQLPETKEKRKLTQTEANKRRKTTIVKTFGVSNISQVPEIKAKKEKIFSEKFGAPFITQTQHFKDVKKQKCLQKFGFEFHSQVPEIQKKTRETHISKYGTHYSKTEEYRQKVKHTRAQNTELLRPRRGTKMGNYYDLLLSGEGVYNDNTNFIFYLKRNFSLDLVKRDDKKWYLNAVCMSSTEML